MAKRQNIDDLMKEAISVWHQEGMDPTDSDTPLYNLHNDPVTRMILGAVNHQTNMLSDDIASFREDLATSCLDLAAPDYLSSPLPAIGMLQTAKNSSMGSKNRDKTFLDEQMSFVFSKESGIKRLSFPFMPLFSIAVMDLVLRSVVKVGRNRWQLELEEREEIQSLEGLSFYLPSLNEKIANQSYIHDRAHNLDERIRLFSGDIELSVCNISDFDRLPFVKPFLDGMAISKNAFQCSTLQNIHDVFCCNVSNYCIISGNEALVPLIRRDGCILLDMVINDADSDLELIADDILLNCVPIVNVEMHSTSLTKYNPVQRLDLAEGYFLTTLSGYGTRDDAFVLRKVATERMSSTLWLKKMGQLIDVYDSQRLVMEHLLDDKLEQAMHTFMEAIKLELAKQPANEDGLYLVLKDKMVSSLSAMWLSTSGEKANDLTGDIQIECSSAELDPNRTKLVAKTKGGRAPITSDSARLQALRYYQVSRDRIISKADIIAFCRHKLISLFAVGSDDINEMRIKDMLRNSSEGFYERILVVDIKLRKDILDPFQASRALERMIESRTASTTHIRVIIRES